MRFTYLTDSKSNLSDALLIYGLHIIDVSKYQKGRITYALDKALNNSEQVIYFVKEENVTLVKEIINNELKVHEGKIFLVNLDTMTIGNNNLVLRSLRSDEPLMTIRNYKGKIEEFTSKDFIFFNSLVKQHA